MGWCEAAWDTDLHLRQSLSPLLLPSQRAPSQFSSWGSSRVQGPGDSSAVTSDGCPCHKGGEAWEWTNFLTGSVSLFCHHLLPLPGALWKMRTVQVGSAVWEKPPDGG